jgi:hypothetical protein
MLSEQKNKFPEYGGQQVVFAMLVRYYSNLAMGQGEKGIFLLS